MARRPLIAGNWKMHKTHLEGVQLTQKLAWALSREDTDAVEVAVCPPFTALRSVGTLIDGDKLPIALGAQDCHPEAQGAYTGEVSAPMLVELGVGAAILGHSERRELFAETDEALARKVTVALDAGILPILCVGESESERDAGETEAVLTRQLDADLARVAHARLAEVVIAYEPIWAIGTGRTATPDQAEEALAFIRDVVRQRGAAADQLRILYGGSVKASNAASLLAVPDVGGALVGGASLKADEFLSIARAAKAG